MESKCKGCRIYYGEDHPSKCLAKLLPLDGEGCPCKTCIIKTMCEHNCEEFTEYIKQCG